MFLGLKIVSEKAKSRTWVALGFGLGAAIFWHFVHAASESYIFALNNPHFWFHLLLEGLIALYGFGMTIIVWTVLERMYKGMN